MLCRVACLVLLSAILSSCAYAYDILAVARDGRLVFIVNPASSKSPSCLRRIEVVAERPAKAQAEAGDDAERVGYGTFWFESLSYDDNCANSFPLAYGAELKGERQRDRGVVKAKPLLREVVYDVSSTTGATGYGAGRFIIHANGRIENLSLESSPTDTSNVVENAK